MILSLFKNIAGHARGATAIEYAMIGLLISIAAFSVLINVGTSVGSLFQSVVDSF